MPETKEQTIARQQREIERLKASLRAATRRQDAAYRVYGPEQDVHIARPTVLDDIIGNPRRLYAVTLCTAEQFDYILYRYAARMKEHGDTRSFGMIISGRRTRATAPSCTFGTPCCYRSCARREGPPKPS